MNASRAARFANVRLETGPRLHYADSGNSDGEPVVLIHGWPDSWFSFSRVLPLLPESVHALAVDQRGFGDSDRPLSGYTIPEMTADVIAFPGALGIERATLVGHSFGTFVARQAAIARPERVAGLVLIGTGFATSPLGPHHRPSDRVRRHAATRADRRADASVMGRSRRAVLAGGAGPFHRGSARCAVEGLRGDGALPELGAAGAGGSRYRFPDRGTLNLRLWVNEAAGDVRRTEARPVGRNRRRVADVVRRPRREVRPVQVVPRNSWHTARMAQAARMLFITPGEGTENVAESDIP